MSHICPECQLEHQVDEPAEVVEEIVAADAMVSIANIEAERDVTLAKINAGNEKVWQEGRVAELEGQLLGMKEILDRLNAPPPEPEPVPVVVAPEPEPLAEPAAAAEPPPLVDEPPKSKKRGNPFWS